jgi:hypothetical protein
VVLPQLRRIRWAVRATLLLGVAASVLANILHALDNPISQAIAAWPPIALLLTVELISRVPVHRRLLAAARLIATAIIAGIAAWVSYWHMAGVAARYGETGASPYLLPLSVDGLIVVASICLVELGGRIASLDQARDAASHIMTDALTAGPADRGSLGAGAAPRPVPAMGNAPVAVPVAAAATGNTPVAVPVSAAAPGHAPAAVQAPGHAPAAVPVAADAGPAGASSLRRSTAAALAEVAAALPRSTPGERGFAPTVTRGGGIATRLGAPNGRPAPAQRRAASAGRGNSSGNTGAGHAGQRGPTTKSRRSPAETVALAARIKAERPTLTEAELAAELGISPSRWRTVRREAAQSPDRQLAA